MYTGKSGLDFTNCLSLISRMKYRSSWVRPTAKAGITTLPPRAMVSSMILARFVGVAPHLRVVAVAVGGLHHHIVRPGKVAGIPDDGLIHVAQIAGEDRCFLVTPFSVAVTVMQALPSRCPASANRTLTPSHSSTSSPYSQVVTYCFTFSGVLNGIQRLHLGGAGTGRLAVLPLSVGLLDVGGVQQHDVHEVSRQHGW